MGKILFPLNPDFKLTPKQEEANKIIKSKALYILLYGGARSAKTFLIILHIVFRSFAAPGSRHAILRFRFNHVRASVINDTFPKVMELCFPGCPYQLDKQDWFIKFPNGSEIWFGGLDDKERTEKILGNEYVTIFLNECSQASYNSFQILQTRLAQVCKFVRDGKTQTMKLKFFLDENPPSKGHWSNKLFIDKVDPISKSKLPNPEKYANLKMNPVDNKENLPDEYLKILDGMTKRQRDRFYLGNFTDESENALWTAEIIEASRVTELPDMRRIVVAVDPSGSGDEDNKDNDEIGIVVAGIGTDGLGYVLEDITLKAGPATWAKVATDAYHRHRADRLVAEINFGGAMVESTIRTADRNIPFKALHASRGKVIRAEPISALHEQGKIKLYGRFDLMEDEMCAMTNMGFMGQGSPNRVDAMVWAFTELFDGIVSDPEPVEPERYTIPERTRLFARHKWPSR